jgi:uncharacterized protein YdeI (YjbR/CyaY-like superfamily)
MEVHKGVKTYCAKSAADWRRWLEKNHAVERSVWLIIYRKRSGIRGVHYPEAVEEALCFGWIDSKANKRDEYSYYQFFARRNPKSNWSRINKTRVEQLVRDGRMTPAGLRLVQAARQNGGWTALDQVEDLLIPGDLRAAFNKQKKAWAHWEKFPRSAKKGILDWINNAKRPETRQNRISQTVLKAKDNQKANQYVKKQ